MLWCNAALGVAGDMLLGALLAVGADEAFVRSQLGLLSIPGWSLRVETTTRRGLVATRAAVDHPNDDHHRPWSAIDSMLDAAGLHGEVADGARRTFRAIGEAEAAVHGVGIDEVHFHEVGAVDAIVDIVGSWAALVSLGVDGMASSPIGLGAGTAAMAHGRVPVPAPAVLGLLVGVPTVGVDDRGETATPTGVALLSTMVDTWGPPPGGTVLGSGRGAGSRDPDSHPNVVTAVLFDTGRSPSAAHASVVLETNVDDVTSEVLAHVVALALDRGADDAWVTPIVMKKGRPAHLLSVLCSSDLAPALRHLVAVETGTLGIREHPVVKHEMTRRTVTVEVHGHPVRIKVGPHGAKPEHDDVVVVADALGRPVRDVAALALHAWRTGAS